MLTSSWALVHVGPFLHCSSYQNSWVCACTPPTNKNGGHNLFYGGVCKLAVHVQYNSAPNFPSSTSLHKGQINWMKGQITNRYNMDTIRMSELRKIIVARILLLETSHIRSVHIWARDCHGRHFILCTTECMHGGE